jgi:hypothetical protein
MGDDYYLLFLYSVEQNNFHLVCFGIFADVNIPEPLYFFFFEVPNSYFCQ